MRRLRLILVAFSSLVWLLAAFGWIAPSAAMTGAPAGKSAPNARCQSLGRQSDPFHRKQRLNALLATAWLPPLLESVAPALPAPIAAPAIARPLTWFVPARNLLHTVPAAAVVVVI